MDLDWTMLVPNRRRDGFHDFYVVEGQKAFMIGLEQG